jgi:carboxymethylenebutenolidase
MKQFQAYMARDGHTFTAYLASPEGQARAAVIIVQEIFGVTPWIKRIADGYAADGYLAVAPQLYDRIQRNLVLDYSDTEHARGYRQQIPPDQALLDIAASAAVVKHVGRVGIIGFCWGGTLAWASASSVAVSAAVCYYGAGILEQSSRVPKCPTMLHFGEQDKGIPLSDVQGVRDAYPQGQFHLYPAGHGFANEDRPDHYDAASAALARTRTLDFLHQYVG